MNKVATSSGVALALAFMVLSAVINWRYGAGLGRDSADQLIYAAVSLAADLAKAATPFFFWYALTNARWMPALAAALFWITCTAYSLASAAGFAEISRASQTGSLSAQKGMHDALAGDLARKSGQLAAIGPAEPAGVLVQKLEVERQSARWRSSKGCTDATTKESRAFCAAYNALEAALENSRAAAQFEEQIAALRSRIAGLAGAAHLEHGDPRAGFLVRLTGWDAAAVQTGFILLFVAVLEIGSGLGLFIALSHGGQAGGSAASHSGAGALPAPAITGTMAGTAPAALPTPEVAAAEPNTGSPEARAVSTSGDVAKFARAVLTGADGGELSFDELYAAYAAWSAQNDVTALAREAFDARFTALCRAVGFQPRRKNGRMMVTDLALSTA